MVISKLKKRFQYTPFRNRKKNANIFEKKKISKNNDVMSNSFNKYLKLNQNYKQYLRKLR